MIKLNTIYNEDCLETMKGMPDGFVDWLITDPPYGINVAKDGHISRGGRTDGARNRGFTQAKQYLPVQWDISPPSTETFNEMFRISKNQIIFGMNYFSLPPTNCFVFWHKKGTSKAKFADGELIWTSSKTAAKYFNYPWIGFGYLNNPDRERKAHPTQKPQRLMKYLINTFTKEGDIVYDPFSGSGSTLVAAKHLNRNYIGSEISKEYCEIAEKRLKQEVLL